MDTTHLLGWLSIAAILAGPLVGIWVTRFIDKANEAKRKKEAVLEGLIRTRGLELSPDHVSNLNLVPLFFKEVGVRTAYSRFMESAVNPSLSSQEEEVVRGAVIGLNAARQDLIREIAKAVGVSLSENEVERLGYAPMGWQRQHNEIEQLRRMLVETLEGKRSIPMIAGIWELPSNPPEQIDEGN